jgi:hypothetical protein
MTETQQFIKAQQKGLFCQIFLPFFIHVPIHCKTDIFLERTNVKSNFNCISAIGLRLTTLKAKR